MQKKRPHNPTLLCTAKQ